jgi:hypothetical protein
MKIFYSKLMNQVKEIGTKALTGVITHAYIPGTLWLGEEDQEFKASLCDIVRPPSQTNKNYIWNFKSKHWERWCEEMKDE